MLDFSPRAILLKKVVDGGFNKGPKTTFVDINIDETAKFSKEDLDYLNEMMANHHAKISFPRGSGTLHPHIVEIESSKMRPRKVRMLWGQWMRLVFYTFGKPREEGGPDRENFVVMSVLDAPDLLVWDARVMRGLRSFTYGDDSTRRVLGEGISSTMFILMVDRLRKFLGSLPRGVGNNLIATLAPTRVHVKLWSKWLNSRFRWLDAAGHLLTDSERAEYLDKLCRLRNEFIEKCERPYVHHVRYVRERMLCKLVSTCNDNEKTATTEGRYRFLRELHYEFIEGKDYNSMMYLYGRGNVVRFRNSLTNLLTQAKEGKNIWAVGSYIGRQLSVGSVACLIELLPAIIVEVDKALHSYDSAIRVKWQNRIVKDALSAEVES